MRPNTPSRAPRIIGARRFALVKSVEAGGFTIDAEVVEDADVDGTEVVVDGVATIFWTDKTDQELLDMLK